MKQEPAKDDLLQRYDEASAMDQARPSPRVREAVLAHARSVLEAQAGADAKQTAKAPSATAAGNDPSWRLRALGTLATFGLLGLLYLQFDSGREQEREFALGSTRVGVEATRQAGPDATPTSAAAPTAVPTAQTQSTPLPAAVPLAPFTPATPATPAAKTAPATVQSPAILGEKAALASKSTPAATPAEPAAPATAERRAEKTLAADQVQTEALSRTVPAGRVATGVGVPDPPPLAEPSARQANALSTQRSAAGAPSLLDTTPRVTLAPQASERDRALSMPNLHQAVRQGNRAAFETLLAQGPMLETSDAAGLTPLLLAVQLGRTQMVERLLAAGANPNALSREGLGALQLVLRRGSGEIETMLRAAGARP